MKLFFSVATAIAALGIGMAFLNQPVGADAKLTPQQQRYCAAVDEWRAQALFEVPERSRTGHPDHKNVYATLCR